MDDVTELHTQLRAWARGHYPREAAAELLIRAGLAHPREPWVRVEPAAEGGRRFTWIDFECIPQHLGATSSDDQNLLMFAASLSAALDAPRVRIGDLVSIGEDKAALLAASVAHAGGRRAAWDDLQFARIVSEGIS